MHIFDPKFNAKSLMYYLVQTAIATAFMFLTFLVLNQLVQLVVVAALGSSAFTVFSMPHRHRSKARYVVGSHLACLATGSLLRLLVHNWLAHQIHMTSTVETMVACSLAVGASLFVMAIADLEHPPAAGTAMGTAVADFSIEVAVTVALGATMLSIGRFLLRRWLKDLA